MERVRGIEPLSSGWKPDIINHYTIPAYVPNGTSADFQPAVKINCNGPRPPEAPKEQKVVGVRGLEPPTSSSQTTRASQLRHTPI